MRRTRFLSWSWITVLIMAGMARMALSQSRHAPRYEEPKWFKFRLSEVSAGAYAEAIYNKTVWEDSNVEATYRRVFVGPLVGLFGAGSIYHPNLIQYNLNAEGAFGWAHEENRSGDSTVKTDEFDYLGTFGLSMNALSGKDYNGSAFVNYDNTYRDNDFYSRLLVQSWRYGVRTYWQVYEPLTLTATYSRRDEESSSRYPARFLNPADPSQGTVTDYNQLTTTQDDTATFGARHARDRGETSFDYIHSRYTRTDFGQIGDGTDDTFSLADQERFGSRDQYRLNTSLAYSLRDNEIESEDLLANASLGIEHRSNLSSYYDFSYSGFDTDDFSSDAYMVQAGLQHRLYESLTTGLLVRGSDTETSDQFNEGYTRRYGAGISEDYTKALSEDHRIRLGAAVFWDHTDQQNIGTVVNERHAITLAGEGGAPAPFSFFLNLPGVDVSSIVITDQRDAPPFFLQGFDYDVTQVGTRTLITWLRPLPPGNQLTVLVDYEAEPTPAGEYDTVGQNYYVRFELWKNLLGLYGRLSLSDNTAATELRVQEFSIYTAGADLTWRGFRTGAEYQVYDYSDSDYQVFRLFQSYGFRPDELSSFNIDLNQMWIDYKDRDHREEDYRLMLRYFRTLTRRLGLNAEAGTAFRRGEGADQLLATIRPSIKYMIGRTSIDAGYFYQFEKFLNEEERQRHMMTVRLRRVF